MDEPDQQDVEGLIGPPSQGEQARRMDAGIFVEGLAIGGKRLKVGANRGPYAASHCVVCDFGRGRFPLT